MSVEALSNSKSTSLLQKHPTITLDTRGMVCPYPMIETRKLSERLGQSDVAEVLTDIEATAKTSIPLVCGGCYGVVGLEPTASNYLS